MDKYQAYLIPLVLEPAMFATVCMLVRLSFWCVVWLALLCMVLMCTVDLPSLVSPIPNLKVSWLDL